jgi:hypothetical protein
VAQRSHGRIQHIHRVPATARPGTGRAERDAVIPTGNWFYTYVLNVLLNQRLSLNIGVPDRAFAANTVALTSCASSAAKPRPSTSRRWTDTSDTTRAATRWTATAGRCSCGSDLGFSPLQVMPDGSYVMAGGLLVGFPVKLALDSDGGPHIEIIGVETVRRTTGP